MPTAAPCVVARATAASAALAAALAAAARLAARAVPRGNVAGEAAVRWLLRILKIQASLTAHWHDKGADWRGLAHTHAHHRSRLSDSVKNGNALRTMHNAALPAR